MRLAYIAMPYRAATTWEIHQNIEAAKRLARKYWKSGLLAVVCPHANTAHFDGADILDTVWLRGTLEILKRCDVVVMGPRWKRSPGAIIEHDTAQELGIEILYDDSPETELFCYGEVKA